MSSTYSSNLRLELISSGEQASTWGNTTNTNLGTLIEEALTGIVEIDISASNKTLTALNGAFDQARAMVIVATGSAGVTRSIITPANVSKVYIVDNSASSDIEIVTAASGSPVSVAIPAGTAKFVYTDGTDFYEGSNAADAFTANTITADTVTISGTPTNSTDATTVGAVNTVLTSYLPKAGGTMSGAINMGTTNKITNMATPTSSADAATKAYVDTVAGGAGIPSTTKMLFAQASPPAGWTQVTTYNNYAMRIVSGGGGGTGGSVGFTTAFASQTPSGSVSVSGTVGGTAITEAQMPSHSHSAPGGNGFILTGNSPGTPVSYVGTNGFFNWVTNTNSTGAGQTHTHGFTGSGSFTGTSINLAVQYLDVIIASKD
jgi:hypothetical protein